MAPTRSGRLRGWLCRGCQARAANLTVLRKAGANRARLSAVWQTSAGATEAGPDCPACQRPTRRVNPSGDLELDVCRSCMLVFFDAGELEQLTPVPAWSAAGSQAASYAASTPAKRQAEQVFAKAIIAQENASEPAPGGWDHVLLSMGIPVQESTESVSVPWATAVLVALLLFGALFIGMAGNPEAAETLAFFSDDPWRHAGLSWLSHPLLQGDFIELLMALYILVVAGPDIEHCQSSVGLLIGAAAIAIVSAALSLPSHGAWLCGAGGLATGLVTFTTLRFPRRQMRMGRHWQHARLPLFVIYAVAYALLVLAFRMEQSAWEGDPLAWLNMVDALPHLAGMACGAAAWALSRR